MDKNVEEGARELDEIYKIVLSSAGVRKPNKETGLRRGGDYGLSDIFEYAAEISYPEFREKLRKLNLWQRFKNAVAKIIGLTAPSDMTDVSKVDAYTKSMEALDKMLDNFDYTAYKRFQSRFHTDKMLEDLVTDESVDEETLNNELGGGWTIERATKNNIGTEREQVYNEFKAKQDIEIVNKNFNDKLAKYTIESADNFVFYLGNPSSVLIKAGVEDKPMKLYGSKIAKKQKKHGFDVNDLQNLPRAMANPIAVFDNHNNEGNRSVLTELKTNDGNILVAVDLGKGGDIDFNIISSAFGKSQYKVEDWLRSGVATYINNEKVQDYLHLAAPIAAASNNTGLSTGANIQPNNELNKFLGEKLYIRTENFKKWFGDWQKDPENASKVVDENGEPLVVYHGASLEEFYVKDGHLYTRSTERFNTFKQGQGFFTPDKDAAETFGSKRGQYAVYLNMRNPFVFDCHGPFLLFMQVQKAKIRQFFKKITNSCNVLIIFGVYTDTRDKEQ